MRNPLEALQDAFFSLGFELSSISLLQTRLRRLCRSREDNFDLSIVLPFYKKLAEFQRVLPRNAPYFERNGIEVLLVLDEPSEESGVLSLIQEYPFINWRVLVNDRPHEWRNPAKAINVGIRHATRSKILIMSPESVLQSDAIKVLAEYVASHPRRFATGVVRFENAASQHWYAAGSLCATREALERAGGYNEAFSDWGAEDDNIRLRLKRAGYRKKQLISARQLHTELSARPDKKCSASSRKILDGTETTANPEKEWGRDFSRISFDYQQYTHAPQLCRKYLDSLEAASIEDPRAFATPKKVVALIQCHHNPDINECLSHVAEHSDGIILLDDGSTDDTYEKASHPKLLIKAKKTRQGFNDLENRNILLRIASFIPSQWFYFIDTDERFDPRFETPHHAADLPHDLLRFNLLHLWDSDDSYRVDYPSTRRGIVVIDRMFRNIGSSQIRGTKRLHFRAAPYNSERPGRSRIVLLHSGHMQAEKRRQKFAFYTEQDIQRDQASYRHFLDENPRLGKVADFQLD